MAELDFKLAKPEPQKSAIEDLMEPYTYEGKLEYLSKKEEINASKTTDVSTGENENLIKELFKQKGFIAHEQWEKTININSRISHVDKEVVICECLIDKENKIFEQRSFPRYLFNHIDEIETKPYVLLSIQSKTGSTRIDVLKGTNLVDKQAFEFKDEWEKLDENTFNQPLDKPIQL